MELTSQPGTDWVRLAMNSRTLWFEELDLSSVFGRDVGTLQVGFLSGFGRPGPRFKYYCIINNIFLSRGDIRVVGFEGMVSRG